ncbi:hypothetical protein [Maribacter sp. ACAM166]|uniref:hypothetical protein n=1 Tax=Maribacter sp. ACAM166 TaxID=2508996 RepID=UPI0010FF5E00|nr:hypothetical protein [Maribacter sp. ACAM166]TLP81382.1 hypothetical protein ES765_05075 [Maribacter sp. ACAM166]
MADITAAEKKEIDAMTYAQHLQIWRHTPSQQQHPFLTHGTAADYFLSEMWRKKDALPHSQRVAASKNVGW